MKKRFVLKRIAVAVLSLSLLISGEATYVFADSFAGIEPEENELQLDSDLASEEESGPVVEEKITITSQPEDITVYAGVVYRYDVAAEGNGLTYQWQYSENGGKTWRNTYSTRNYFVRTAYASENGYIYRCIITDADGNTVTSDAAALTIITSVVTDPVVIISQPEDITVSAGDAFEFHVAAEGDVSTYSWQYSTDGGSTWINTTGAASNYTGTASAEMNGYMYRCVITGEDQNSVISNNVSLTITNPDKADPIVITSQPEDIIIDAGITYRFDVIAEGNGLTYQWQCSENNGLTWRNTYSTKSYFVRTAYAAESGDMYRCVITDADGNTITSDAATLTITDPIILNPIVITSQPKDITIAAGKIYRFDVTAEGSGLTYQWQCSENKGLIWKNTYSTKSYFVRTAYASENGDMYRCVITDANGNTITSDTATITIVSE